MKTPKEKVCSHCGTVKPLREFSMQAAGLYGRRSYCKSCQSEMGREYRAANREKVLDYNRRYRDEHREVRRAYNLEWNKANRDKTDKATKEWRARNPDKVRAQKHNNRLRRREAPGVEYTVDEHITWRRQMFGFRCYYCGGPDETIDHRIPIARGGYHLPANLVPACVSCNSRKQMRTEREFRREVVPSPHG